MIAAHHGSFTQGESAFDAGAQPISAERRIITACEVLDRRCCSVQISPLWRGSSVSPPRAGGVLVWAGCRNQAAPATGPSGQKKIKASSQWFVKQRPHRVTAGPVVAAGLKRQMPCPVRSAPRRARLPLGDPGRSGACLPGTDRMITHIVRSAIPRRADRRRRPTATRPVPRRIMFRSAGGAGCAVKRRTACR